MSKTSWRNPLDPTFRRLWLWRDLRLQSVRTHWKEWFAPIEPISPAVRVEVGNRLKSISYTVNASTARVVLEAQIDAVRILREASTSLDTKANVIVVASGALLTAFVTISPAEKSHFPLWTLIAALFLLGGAFLSGILAMFVAAFSLPTPVVYNRYSTLSDPQNEGKICSELAEAWYRYGLSERRLIARKANRVILGFTLVTLALMLLVIGAAESLLAPDPVKASVAPPVSMSRNLDVL
jgi:hypothetical protein